MGRIIIFLLLITVATTTNAQNFKFGKVSKEELKEKQHPLDPEANAAVLYKSENISFVFSKNEGFEQVREVYERIKIYNKEGYDYATKKLKYYNENSSSKESVTGIKGYTYVLKNESIEKLKLKNENIFDNENNKFWATKSFTMPRVEEGCVIEFEYSIITPFMEIEDVIIQYDIPINKLDVHLAIPEYYNYNKFSNLKAQILPDIKESRRYRKEKITSSTRTGVYASKTNFSSQEFNFAENVIDINMEDIPSLIKEPFVDNINNYRGKLAFEYAFYKSPKGGITPYSTTWDKVTETIYKSENFGDQLKKRNYFEEDLSRILKNSFSDVEKVTSIYEFVKSKIKWNDFVGYYTNEGVKKAYKEGVGNVAEINLVLVSMLKAAEINAHPVLVSTRDNGMSLFPSRNGFNYVICAIEDGQNITYLDATQQNASPNILPTRAINWLGRIIRNDNTSDWVSLSPNKISKEIISLNLNLNDDLSEKGKLRKRLTNYLAYNYRNDNKNKTEDRLIQDLESKNSGLLIDKYSQENVDNNYKQMNYYYDFTYEGAAEEIANKVYLSPLAFLISEENPFKLDNRNYPIDFITPTSTKYIVNIFIPNGYVFESIPESAAVKFNNDAASFTYVSKIVGNKIQIIVDTEIKQTLITPEQYPVFKKFYQFVKDKQSEKIVLKKV